MNTKKSSKNVNQHTNGTKQYRWNAAPTSTPALVLLCCAELWFTIRSCLNAFKEAFVFVLTFQGLRGATSHYMSTCYEPFSIRFFYFLNLWRIELCRKTNPILYKRCCILDSTNGLLWYIEQFSQKIIFNIQLTFMKVVFIWVTFTCINLHNPYLQILFIIWLLPWVKVLRFVTLVTFKGLVGCALMFSPHGCRMWIFGHPSPYICQEHERNTSLRSSFGVHIVS